MVKATAGILVDKRAAQHVPYLRNVISGQLADIKHWRISALARRCLGPIAIAPTPPHPSAPLPGYTMDGGPLVEAILAGLAGAVFDPWPGINQADAGGAGGAVEGDGAAPQSGKRRPALPRHAS